MLGALAVAIAVLVTPAAGQPLSAGAERLAPGEVPKRAATLGAGKLWGAPWELATFGNDKVTCVGLVRRGGLNICTNVPPIPDPILVPASFTNSGPKPTTFAVIVVSEEVARVAIRLNPGGRTLSPEVQSLTGQESRRSGVPSGFRYTVVAVAKRRDLKLVRGFAADGRLVGQVEDVTVS